MKKVVLVDQELPHYRAQVLSALKEFLGIRLIVYSPKNPEWQNFIEPKDRDVSFENRGIGGIWFPPKRLLWLNYFRILLKEGRPDLFIVRHWIRHPLLIPFMVVCRLLRIPVVVWGQGFSRHRPFRPKKNIFDFCNLVIVRLANAYVGYSDQVVGDLSRHVSSEKLFVARNTLNLSGIDEVIDSLRATGVVGIKRNLGLTRGRYLVFSGRLQKRKRVDFLIRSFKYVQIMDPSVGLLIIGDGPERRHLEALARDVDPEGILFLGAMDFAESAPYLFSSDVMVIPGWLGLAVNHGFRFGLPVVTCKGGEEGTGHPPEIEWLQDGRTGLISGALTEEEFARDIGRALGESERLGGNAERYYKKNLDIGIMLNGFERAVAYATGTWGKQKTFQAPDGS